MKAFKFFLLLFLFNLGYFNLFADIVINASKMEVDYKNNIFNLSGNVSLNTKDYFMTTDNLIYKKQEKTVMANGNIVIEFIKDKRRVNADTMIRTKESLARESTLFTGKPVRLVDFEKERTIEGNLIRIVKNDNKESIFIEGNAVVFDDKLKINSDKIEYFKSDKFMLMYTNSSIKKDDYIIKTEGIKYLEDDKILIFDKETRIDKKDISIVAKRGKYDEKQDVIEADDVTYIKENTKIVSDKLLNLKKDGNNFYVFKDVKEIKDKNMLGKANEIEYEEKKNIILMKTDAFIEDKSKDLDIRSDVIRIDNNEDKVFLIGSVNIRQKDKVISSSLGYYDKKSNKMVLTGNPVYKKGNDLTYAQIIILDTSNNNVVMQGEIKGRFDIKKEK